MVAINRTKSRIKIYGRRGQDTTKNTLLNEAYKRLMSMFLEATDDFQCNADYTNESATIVRTLDRVSGGT